MSKLSRSELEFVTGQAELAPRPAAELVAAPAGAKVAPSHEIDARGISPPLHILRAHRALRAMQPGDVLKVVTTSAQTVAEFQALSKFVVGYELISQEQKGEEFVHLLRKKR
jgi:tRNA 2-thiouridine synthesizing protein A